MATFEVGQWVEKVNSDPGDFVPDGSVGQISNFNTINEYAVVEYRRWGLMNTSIRKLNPLPKEQCEVDTQLALPQQSSIP